MTTAARRCLGRGSALVWLIGLALSAGCTWHSAPVRFYVLAGTPPSTATASSTEPEQGPTLGVGPITLPRYLERVNIVTLRGAELDVAEFDRWGEPLSEGVPRAIAADLATLLGTERIVIFPWSGSRSIDHQVVVDVLRFDGTSGGDVLLEARWRILGAEKKELELRYSVVREPTGEAGYPALVAAMSRSVGILSREIADAVTALRARTTCGAFVACRRSEDEAGGAIETTPSWVPEELGDRARTPCRRAGVRKHPYVDCDGWQPVSFPYDAAPSISSAIGTRPMAHPSLAESPDLGCASSSSPRMPVLSEYSAEV